MSGERKVDAAQALPVSGCPKGPSNVHGSVGVSAHLCDMRGGRLFGSEVRVFFAQVQATPG